MVSIPPVPVSEGPTWTGTETNASSSSFCVADPHVRVAGRSLHDVQTAKDNILSALGIRVSVVMRILCWICPARSCTSIRPTLYALIQLLTILPYINAISFFCIIIHSTHIRTLSMAPVESE